MKIVNKEKFFARIVELIIIIATIILTAMSINYARVTRGYNACGGEYMIPLIGVIAILVIETIMEEKEVNDNGRS